MVCTGKYTRTPNHKLSSFSGIFGPGFLCRTSRKQMLLRSLKSDDMEMKSPRNMSWIDSVASRVDGLYGGMCVLSLSKILKFSFFADCIVASSIPSTFIPPFVFTESIGPDILSLSAAMDCLDIHKPPARPCLPVINIPNVSFGVPHLIKNGKSISFCLSEAARTLYKKWGVPECSVDEETGEVVKKDLHDFPFSIPLVNWYFAEHFFIFFFFKIIIGAAFMGYKI
jgi:hypothetical protein